MPNLTAAREYLSRGWLPIPLMKAGTQYRNKETGAVEVSDGKTPASKFAHLADLEPPFDPAFLGPWERRPELGVGIMLKPSHLVVIDCDSKEAVAEAVGMTPERCNNVVITRQGAHLYYRRPEGCPAARAIRKGASGKIDVMAAGYMVAPPSVRGNGFQYQWFSRRELQMAPDWAVGLLMAVGERQATDAPVIDPALALLAQPVDMGKMSAMFFNAPSLDYLSGRTVPVDRSKAIWLCILDLMRFGASDEQIFREIWYGPLGEKPRSRGPAWLSNEIARARRELDDERRVILAGLTGQGAASLPDPSRQVP